MTASRVVNVRLTDDDIQRLDAIRDTYPVAVSRSGLIVAYVRAGLDVPGTRSSVSNAQPTGDKDARTRSARPALAVVDGGEDAPAECDHPKETWHSTGYSTLCGVCGAVVKR